MKPTKSMKFTPRAKATIAFQKKQQAPLRQIPLNTVGSKASKNKFV